MQIKQIDNLYKFLIIINIVLFIDFAYQIYESFNIGWSLFLNSYVKVIQDFLFFFVFICLFKKINLKYLLIAYPIAIIETKIAFFNNYIHPIFIDINLYSLFSNQPDNISPDLLRVVVLFSILIIYIIKTIRKYEFKSIFLILSMCGIFFTALLFHSITLSQLNFFMKQQEQTIKLLSTETNLNILKSKCTLLEVDCIIKNKDISIFNSSLPNNIIPYIKDIQPSYDSYSNYFYYTISNSNKIIDRIGSRKPIAFIKTNHFQIIIIDNINYTKFLRFNELLFGILAFISHLVWCFGSLYLIYFHQKRATRK